MINISIIGLGLIGSSIGRVLFQSEKYNVFGYDISKKEREDSITYNVCHKCFDNIEDAVKDADIVLISTPVSSFDNILSSIKSHLKDGCIITDVGSVKQNVISVVNKHIENLNDVVFVPGHPISGTEKNGAKNGFDTLFKDRYVIICENENVKQIHLEKIYDIWNLAGAKIEIMDASHHDIVLGVTSHLPHVIAYSLVDFSINLENNLFQTKRKEVIKYSAGGFRDSTRVAASSPKMWADIFIENKNVMLELINGYKDNISKIENMIKNEDKEGLLELMKNSKKVRQEVIDLKQAGKFIPND